MKKVIFLCFLILGGCGYTTRGFVYKEKTVYIKPVVNKVNITSERRAYSSYNTYPILVEKRLTNSLVNKFNIDGNLKVVGTKDNSLSLQCEIRNYDKEALRYADNDSVTEQRLRLYVHCNLYDEDGTLLKEKDVVGDTTYFLSGRLAKTESSAQTDVINDAARRIVEAVVEEW